MKGKIFKWIIVIAIIIGAFFLGRQVGLDTEISNTTTTITEENVSKQTIQKTLTSSGQIETGLTESIVPDTTEYFETMCVEEDDIVKMGENILQYSDGTYLVAEYDCVIVSYSMPETGKKCTSSNYVEVKSMKDLITTISVNENEINELSVGQEVDITLSADESKTFKGNVSKIDFIGSYSSSGTTFSATISFENDGDLKLGMSISCTIILKESTDVLAIPISAVQTSDKEKYVVLVKDNGETENVTIETGMSNDKYVEVISGLEEGDIVQVVTTTTTSTQRNSGSSGFDGMMQGEGGMMMPNGGSVPDGMTMPNGGGMERNRGGSNKQERSIPTN